MKSSYLSLCTLGVRTCQDLKNKGITANGDYMVDPDGFGVGQAPVLVSCNMTARNGQAATIVSHDSEAKTLVSGYDYPIFYMRKVHYNILQSQLAILLTISDHCEQFIRYDCHHSKFWDGELSEGGIWESRSGQNMTYWGGASPGSERCACGMTYSCADPSDRCNCDRNDHVWRFDEGFLSDKSTLPVMKIYFSDAKRSYERGYHTLGKLVCYGLQD